MDDKVKEKEEEKEKQDGTDIEVEEEDEDGNKRNVALVPQVPLKEQLEFDKPDLVLPMPFQANGKGFAFALKDGSPYSFRFSFIVSNNTGGPQVHQHCLENWTKSPQLEPYIYKGEEETTSTGIFARGSYSAKLKFVDDDGMCYMEMTYYIEIRKE
ncbi:hypothetical protein HU200_024899 [Digitaria exilis]|uniref:Uncharacterized protein n=1 Tax=Digitaria exilis TaxID=1010633 RepID=A0A835C804_9POAL|nr:hypothetical protein HU200_024899 [Digitaria exilis]